MQGVWIVIHLWRHRVACGIEEFDQHFDGKEFVVRLLNGSSLAFLDLLPLAGVLSTEKALQSAAFRLAYLESILLACIFEEDRLRTNNGLVRGS